MASRGARVRFDAVGHSFPHAERQLPVLQDISFEVAPGERLAIIGPSGSGKSTLLGMMLGRISPTQGKVEIASDSGAPVRIGVVFQSPTLLPWLTASENVRLPGELEGRAETTSADELLKRVGLKDFGSYKPAQLSGGMQSRVALARALSTEPELLLLDEPFTDLDEASSEEMLIDMSGLAETSGASVVMISHSLVQAAYLADRVLVLSSGPGRVHADIKIEGPRPRRREFLDDPKLHEIVHQLRSALREAIRANAA